MWLRALIMGLSAARAFRPHMLVLFSLSSLLPSGQSRRTRASPGNIVPQSDSAPDPSSNGRHPILWLHFHKCAGSTICSLAQVNGEKTLPGSNCNFRKDSCNGDWEWLSEPHVKSCEQRRTEQVIEAGLSFWGLERWMDFEMCDDISYGTMLRDPMSRIKSNTLYGWQEGWRAETGEIVNLVKPGVTGCVTDKNAKVPSWAMYQWEGCPSYAGYCGAIERSVATYDNFYVRTLAGGDVYRLPAGNVTRAHLERAKARLKQFDVVLLLENYDDDSMQLTANYGWRETTAAHGEQNSVNKTWLELTHGCTGDDCFTPQQLQSLTAANALDIELYEYARELAADRTAAARESIDTHAASIPPDKRPIRNLHISSSGGAALCAIATTVGRETTTREDCNLQDHGSPGWEREDAMVSDTQTTCQTLLDKTLPRNAAMFRGGHKITYFGSQDLTMEHHLPLGMGYDEETYEPCPNFRYVMVFRDPIDRVLSNLVATNGVYNNITETVAAVRHVLDESNTGQDNCPKDLHVSHCLHSLSSAYIRFISGPDHFTAPWRTIGEFDLERTWHMMEKFTMLIPMNELLTPAAAAMSEQRLGWNAAAYNEQTQRAAASSSFPNQANFDETSAEEQARFKEHKRNLIEAMQFDGTLGLLQAANLFDCMLYRRAKEKWAEDVASAGLADDALKVTPTPKPELEADVDAASQCPEY